MQRETASNRRLNTTDAAAYLGVAPRTLTIWRCARRYKINYQKVGRLVYYMQADLDAWLEARTVRFAPDPTVSPIRDPPTPRSR